MGNTGGKITGKGKKRLEKVPRQLPDMPTTDQRVKSPSRNSRKPSVVFTDLNYHARTSSFQTQLPDHFALRTKPKASVKYTDSPERDKNSFQTKDVVAVIEIGYTHSGYVLCMGKRYALDGTGLYCPNWVAKDKGTVNSKTSTAILFRPDTTVFGIGYEAEEYFNRIQNQPDSAKWFFFKNFIKEFCKGSPFEDLTLANYSQSNTTIAAVDVIAGFIKQMKEKLLTELEIRQSVYNIDDIQWMLTLPGTIESSQYKLMNRAATLAGIKHDHLCLVQGPEAELIYYRAFTNSPSTFGEEQVAPLPICYRSILIHFGGVAINLTLVEVKEGKTQIHETVFRTVQSAKEEFIKFLTNLFGEDVMKYLVENYQSEYNEVLYNFDRKLKFFESNEVVTIRIPPQWYEAFEIVTGDTLTNAINQTVLTSAVSLQNDKIRIRSDFFRIFYENSTKIAIQMVQTTLSTESALGIGIVFVAGDHVDRVFVNTLKELYPTYRIIVPKYPELAVLKGTVLYKIVG